MDDSDSIPSGAPSGLLGGSGPGGGLLGGSGGFDPHLLISLGLGLISSGARNSPLRGNWGAGLQQGYENYTQMKQAGIQQALGRQQLATGAMQLARQQGLFRLGDALTQQAAGTGAPSGPGMSTLPPSGGTIGPPPAASGGMGMPPGAAPAMATPGAAATIPPGAASAPSYFAPPTLTDIAGLRVGGVDPRLLRAFGAYNLKDPIETEKGLEDEQLKLAQRTYAPQIQSLASIAQSDNPTRDVAADPQLMATWKHYAVARGLNPDTDFNGANVRQVMGGVANAYRSQLGLPTVAPPIPVKQLPGPLGSLYSQNTETGEIKQEKGEESVGDFVTPQGVRKMTNAEGVSKGYTPFNPTIFGASNISDQSKELAYQTWKSTGELPKGLARNPMMNANMMNYIAQRAQQEGVPGAAAAAQRQAYTAQQGVLNDFTKGNSAKALNAINTSVQHMDLLPPLIDAMQNGNVTALNKVTNWFKDQTGGTAPNNYNAIKDFVSGEVAKAVLPGGGGEQERQALQAPLAAARSPEQLRQAVQQIQQALAGKTEALRNQWDVGTNGTQGEFDRFLMPATKRALGLPDKPQIVPGAHPKLPGQSTTINGFTVTRVQ